MISSIHTKVDIEPILVDNTKNKFMSAAEALEYGMKKSTGEIVCFLHQDIIFFEDTFFERLESYINENQNQLLGVAGVNKTEGIVSSIKSGPWKASYTTIKENDGLKMVITLDEVLIACHRVLFEKKIIHFDKKICDGWHLYGADLCLQAQEKGIAVMVLAAGLHHLSTGNADYNFYITFDRLAHKYQKKFSKIYVTSSWTYTNPILRKILFTYRKLRKIF